MPHRIYQFSQESGEGEFIVISEEAPAGVIAEYKVGGFDLDHIYTIKEDGTSLPTDRVLKAFSLPYNLH